MFSVRDLTVDFPSHGSSVAAVRRIGFDIMPGEILALVGESGSGKSVTALSILDLIPPGSQVRTRGSIRFQGQELVGMPPSELRRLRGNRIGMIFQEPMTSLNPIQQIGRQIIEILEVHRPSSEKLLTDKVLDLLRRVGIQEPERRMRSYPHELSGGQRQRVMIAMAIANQPDLLIADEPTTALDVTVQAQILALLRDMRERLGMAVLLITHDLSIVRAMADRVAVMRHGEIVETASAADLFDRPRHSYTQMLLAAEPKGPPLPARPDAPEILRADAVQVRFPIRSGVFRRVTGHVQAVAGIDLSVRAGETLGVVGESGSGKSTLGLALLRLVSSTGAVTFVGQNLQALKARDLRTLRREMQIVFQDPYGSLSPRMTVGEIIGEGLRAHGMGKADERARLVEHALGEVGLEPSMRERYPHEFSGGQRQRIAIARAIVLRPKLLILDEPTSALDRSVQAQIVDLLRDLQARHGLAYIFISHDLRVVRALASEVLVMRDGKVVEQGPAERIFTAPREDYTKALLAAALG
ncbi:MAG: microcin transporter ATP-binding protein [Rhodospirillales bacterium]|nr:microcin transporter ATP-binding protein [Rhodospirillales bacterium]